MKKISQDKLYKILLVIFLLLTCLQGFTILELKGFSFKAYHLFSLIFLPILLKKERIVLPNKFFLSFFIYIIALSMLSYSKYGINSLIFNYIFCLYIIIVLLNIGKDFTKLDWLKIIRTVAYCMAVLVLLRFIKYRKEIIEFLKIADLNGHPDMIGTYFGGGANLEATWIALLGFSFYKNKNCFLYFFVSALTSIIYISRVGIILNVILFIWLLFQRKDGIIQYKEKIKFKYKLFIVIIIALVMLIVFYRIGILDYILTRMLNTGSADDKGVNGRMMMWVRVPEAFKENPFGYGLGNAIKGLENVSKEVYPDGNVHNIFFQMFLDCGIIGGIYFICLIFVFLKKNIKKFWKDPFVAFIVSYIIAGLMQFRGGDILLYFMVGIHFCLLNLEKRGSNISEGQNLSNNCNIQ